ncbi:hypothetical protein N8653_05785 [Euryarchaeota archaeon]|jgi:hypothetical protein|nr:hypothetical protein [Euryarchaeota archaeon]|tara:strand:- start:2376 stop:2528 length:153 start_codon:yes stop_codon:yes gene_type:complete
MPLEKKKILLRLDPALHRSLQKWADDDLRSFNSQVEFLLRKSAMENKRLK